MTRRRRTRRALLLACGVLPVLAVGTAVHAGAVDEVRGLRHGRNVHGYLTYLKTYIGKDYDSTQPLAGQVNDAWAAADPATVVAAGDAACTWLRTQPRAPRVDPTHSWTGPYTFDTIMSRFADQPLAVAPTLSRSGRAAVAAAAWEYLCWTDREQRTAPSGIND